MSLVRREGMPSIKIRDEGRVRDKLGWRSIRDQVHSEGLEVGQSNLGRTKNALQQSREWLWRPARARVSRVGSIAISGLREAPGKIDGRWRRDILGRACRQRRRRRNYTVSSDNRPRLNGGPIHKDGQVRTSVDGTSKETTSVVVPSSLPQEPIEAGQFEKLSGDVQTR